MKKYMFCILFLLLICSTIIPVQAQVLRPKPWDIQQIQPLQTARMNTYPFVFVHGFAGFAGNDPLARLKYWGGEHDILSDFNAHGYLAINAIVGPISSNWDRACELYAMLKGGRVDYGKVHAQKYGHARYGRSYPGFLHDWGVLIPGQIHPQKIHLIAHSQGGQTARLFTELLAHGSAEEQAGTSEDELSPLFAGGKQDWIASILTLSTPHNGTSLIYAIKSLIPFLQKFAVLIAATQGSQPLTFVDLMLEHWGFPYSEPFKDLSTLLKQLAQHRMWNDLEDTPVADLTPDGAQRFNARTPANPNIYYFSVSTEATIASLWQRHLPQRSMSILLQELATLIGTYTQKVPVPINSEWWLNDGIVNTISMRGPWLGSQDKIQSYTGGQPQRGIWNWLGTMSAYDHLDIIGIGIHDIRPWYRQLAAFLASLPA